MTVQSIARPMLAGTADLKNLVFPVLASPKLDGVRALHVNDRFTSRSLKPFKNLWVMHQFDVRELRDFDGEMIVGDPTAHNAYIATNSALARIYGRPKPDYHVFDLVIPGMGYQDRLAELRRRAFDLPDYLRSRVKVVEQRLCTNEQELLAYEEHQLHKGYEGVMIRSLDGLYKHGRSTVKERTLLKIKRFTDSEAEVLEVVRMMRNDNEAKTNELGLTERSSHAENLKPLEMMGALRVRDIHDGRVFQIGTGFTADDRRRWWAMRDSAAGKIVKYAHFALGNYELPRFPSYKGERMDEDIIV